MNRISFSPISRFLAPLAAACLLTLFLGARPQAAQAPLAAPDSLDEVYAFPVPWELQDNQGFITFTNLPAAVRIEIYTPAYELVKVIESTGGLPQLSWDVTNSQGDALASGVYLYFVRKGEAIKKGKIVVLR